LRTAFPAQLAHEQVEWIGGREAVSPQRDAIGIQVVSA
jgi:hypothetical protein